MNLVSIIIPAYNAEKYIAQTIDSVLNQTYINWELIIINDGSADRTEEIIQSYLYNKNMRYYTQKNSGVSSARNHGITEAKGVYLAFLDADDVWEPKNLELKIKLLDENNGVDWVFSDIYLADINLKKNPIPYAGHDENILDDILLWEEDIIPGPCSNVIIRKKCIDEGCKFDLNLSSSADQDFTLQLAHSYKGKRLPVPLWLYRMGPQSMSRNIEATTRDQLYVYKKASENKLFKSYWFEKRCYANLYLILAGTWWVNGKNKARGFYYIYKSFLNYPPVFFRICKKIGTNFLAVLFGESITRDIHKLQLKSSGIK